MNRANEISHSSLSEFDLTATVPAIFLNSLFSFFFSLAKKWDETKMLNQRSFMGEIRNSICVWIGYGVTCNFLFLNEMMCTIFKTTY
jgi:hypothetical protein